MSADSPTQAIRLFGTEEPVPPRRELIAGPLRAWFDQGALRYIRIAGVEAIRHIEFVVRDKDWGTYQPVISNLQIEQDDAGFRVSFEALCQDEYQSLQYRAQIQGHSDGRLSFHGKGTASTDFTTNRTGFVVLHPVAGVSGHPVSVEHVDGQVERSVFPELIDPLQPFKNIRALTHEVLPGVRITCRMEGDTFETEDHRQWNDASYKTYVRPIGLPWPYTLPAGEGVDQCITLSLDGSMRSQPASGDGPNTCVVTIDEHPEGRMPQIGMGLEPQHAQAALARADLVKQLGVQQLVCWYDLTAGHGVPELRLAKELCSAISARPVLEAVIPGVDFGSEIATLADQSREAGIAWSAVSVSPSTYLKSIMPGTTWPDVPALADIYDAVRTVFPCVTVGGGMLAFFPELNRHRPPVEHLDYVTHCSNTITHACDDITVTENLEALPWIIQTCRSFAGGKPYRVGPSAIALRLNPYGSKTMDNPDNRRIALARMDPRQRGLINAAWTIGYAAHMARGGIEAIALQAPVGEFGLVYEPMTWPQPWYDGAGAQVYPAFHAVSGLASAAGAERLPTASSNSHDVECIAWRSGSVTHVWLANLTDRDQSVELRGLVADHGSVATLDVSTFEACVRDAASFCHNSAQRPVDRIDLSAYAVVSITL